MQGGSRIVIDATGPVRVDRAFVLEAVDNQPARLVVDLVPIDRTAFMRNLALETRQPRASETRKAEREPAKRSNDLPPAGGDRSGPRRPGHRDHRGQRRDGKGDRPRIRPGAAGQARRKSGKVPRGDDAHR
jgi:hypothetical protein